MTDHEATATRLREFAQDFDKLIQAYEEKASTKEDIMVRLEFIFGDRGLARTVYDYAILGHLSYCNQLRNRFDP